MNYEKGKFVTKWISEHRISVQLVIFVAGSKYLLHVVLLTHATKTIWILFYAEEEIQLNTELGEYLVFQIE